MTLRSLLVVATETPRVDKVVTPTILTPPVPVIYLPLISKLPPNCGLVSPKIWVWIPVSDA